jgi:hypothetical protein
MEALVLTYPEVFNAGALMDLTDPSAKTVKHQ